MARLAAGGIGGGGSVRGSLRTGLCGGEGGIGRRRGPLGRRVRTHGGERRPLAGEQRESRTGEGVGAVAAAVQIAGGDRPGGVGFGRVGFFPLPFFHQFADLFGRIVHFGLFVIQRPLYIPSLVVESDDFLY